MSGIVEDILANLSVLMGGTYEAVKRFLSPDSFIYAGHQLSDAKGGDAFDAVHDGGDGVFGESSEEDMYMVGHDDKG